MRTPRALLVWGLSLLGFSLLMTLALASGAESAGNLAALAWFGQASLYVGTGLVIAGEVLQVLRAPAPDRRREGAPFGQTDYWGG